MQRAEIEQSSYGSVPEPLASRLKIYCNVGVPDGIKKLQELMKEENAKSWIPIFKEQLLLAIEQPYISPRDFSELIGQEIRSRRQVAERLFQIWCELFQGLQN